MRASSRACKASSRAFQTRSSSRFRTSSTKATMRTIVQRGRRGRVYKKDDIKERRINRGNNKYDRKEVMEGQEHPPV